MMRALILTLCGVSSVALAAGEKSNPYLAQARVFYQGGDFKKCLERVKQAEKWDSSTQELAEVSLYTGLCRFNSKQQKQAEVDFLRALQTDPSLELPAATSPKIVEAWNRVRAKVPRPEAPAPPPIVTVKEPERQPEPKVVVLTPAAVTAPPPATETKKGQPVAAFVMGGVTVAAVTLGVSFGLLANSNNTGAVMAPLQSDAVRLRGAAETWALVANLSYVTAGAAALTGLLIFFLQR